MNASVRQINNHDWRHSIYVAQIAFILTRNTIPTTVQWLSIFHDYKPMPCSNSWNVVVLEASETWRRELVQRRPEVNGILQYRCIQRSTPFYFNRMYAESHKVVSFILIFHMAFQFDAVKIWLINLVYFSVRRKMQFRKCTKYMHIKFDVCI